MKSSGEPSACSLMSAVIYRAEGAHTCTTRTGESRAGPVRMRTFVGPRVKELIHSAAIAMAGQVPIGRL